MNIIHNNNKTVKSICANTCRLTLVIELSRSAHNFSFIPVLSELLCPCSSLFSIAVSLETSVQKFQYKEDCAGNRFWSGLSGVLQTDRWVQIFISCCSYFGLWGWTSPSPGSAHRSCDSDAQKTPKKSHRCSLVSFLHSGLLPFQFNITWRAIKPCEVSTELHVCLFF